MDKISDFFVSWLIAIKDFLITMPDDSWYLGLIVGFFCAATGWSHNVLHLPGIVLRLTSASSIIALLACLGLGAYIIIQQSAVNLVHYITVLIAGVFICKVLYLFFDLFGRLGSVLDIALNLLSGPMVLFTGWLFYNKELLIYVRKIAKAILR